MKPELRTWEDCAARIASGTANPLDRFVFENELGGIISARKFRQELAESLEWLFETLKKP